MAGRWKQDPTRATQTASSWRRRLVTLALVAAAFGVGRAQPASDDDGGRSRDAEGRAGQASPSLSQGASVWAALGRVAAGGAPSAIDSMLAALEGARGEERARLLRALGKTRDQAALPALLAAARSSSPVERAAGIDALGEVGDAEAVSALVELLGHPAYEVRQQAIAALGHTRHDDARVALKEQAASQDWRNAAEALQALATFQDDDAETFLLGHLERGSPLLAEAAARAIAEHGSPAALDQLAALAARRGAPVEIRMASLRGVARAGGPAVLARLAAVAREGDMFMSGEAVRLLADEVGAEAVPILAEVGTMSPALAYDAARGLGRLATPEARDALVGMMFDGHRTVVDAAASALADLRGPDVDAALGSALDAGGYQTEAALRSLAYTPRGPGLRGSLVRLVERKDRRLAPMALSALATQDPDGSAPLLEELAATGPTALRNVAFQHLTQRRSAGAERALARIADAPGPFQVQAAAALVRSSGGEGRVKDLLALAERAQSPNQRMEAARALAEMGDESLAEPLAALVVHSGRSVDVGLAQTVAAMGNQKVKDAVLERVEEVEDPATRLQLVAGVAQLGNARAIEALSAMAGDSDDAEVARNALTNLSYIDPDRAAPRAIELIASDDPRDRVTALDALAASGGQDAMAHARSALDDDDEGVVARAAEVLAQHGSAEAVATLLEKAEDRPGLYLQALPAALEAGRTDVDQSIRTALTALDPDERSRLLSALVYGVGGGLGSEMVARLAEEDGPAGAAAAQFMASRNPPVFVD